MKPLLFHLRPRLPDVADPIDIRLASGAPAAATGLGGVRWLSAVVKRPRFSLDLFDPTFTAGVQLGRGDVAINLDLIERVEPRIRSAIWVGCDVTVYDVTDLDLASAPIEFKGTVREASFDQDSQARCTLNFEVNDTVLEKPFLFDEFTGGLGAQGDPELRGTPKPAGFGVVKNVPPVWVDVARNIGMVDGYGNLLSVEAMFEGGNDFGPSRGDYADFAALAAAIDSKEIAEGQWGTCIAEGLVGLGAPPFQQMTCDCTFGFPTPGGMIGRVLEHHAGVAVEDIDTDALAALDEAVPFPTHYWTQVQRECRDLAASIAASCNAALLVTFQGQFSVCQAFGGTSLGVADRQYGSPTLRPTAWRRLSEAPPTWRLRMRAARGGIVIDETSILYADDFVDRGIYSAGTQYRQGNLVFGPDQNQYLYINVEATTGSALPVAPATENDYWALYRPAADASQLYYADGTPIEALKPVEVGADVTTYISGPVSTSVVSNADGTFPANYFPKSFYFTLNDRNGVVVGVDWSAITTSGLATYTLTPDGNRVKLEITDVKATTQIEISAAVDGIVRDDHAFAISKATLSGGTALISLPINGNVTGDTHAMISDGFAEVTVGGGGTIRAQALLIYDVTGQGSVGGATAYAKARYRAAGQQAWIDVDVEEGPGTVGEYNHLEGTYFPGNLDIDQQVTGLPAGDYEVSFWARANDATKELYFDQSGAGQVSAP